MNKILFLALALAAPLTFGGEDGHWPQFRGPSGEGRVEAELPLTWSETENVKWKTPVHGRAWSSPVVWNKQIWMTSATEDGTKLFAIRVEAETGEVTLDKLLFEVGAPQFAHKFNSYASPTPVVEAGRAYLTFGSPGTACLDARSGEVLWERRDLECNHFRGAGSSPILHGDLLIMQFDGSDHQYVVALDKTTGETVWKTDRSIDFQDITPEGKIEADGDWRKAYSTPLITTAFGEPLMLSLGSKALYAYRPATGEELWRVEERKCHSGTTRPVVGHGMIFVSMGFARSELLAIKPPAGGGEPEVIWQSSRNAPNKPSPILHGDYLFTVDDGGIASCLDAQTGEAKWRERVGGNYSASPIVADGRIYFFNEEGKTAVVAASPEFKLLASNELGDGYMASPAVIENSLILRDRTHLYRIEE